jgi:hypothetical protein
MSIDYSYMKNGFFMTEKFNFENLSAFNSAEGRIFYPLAVESGDFPQLRSVFSQAMRCGKPVTARILRFSPRSEIFELKVNETFWTRQVVDYSIKSKGYFGKDKSKEESLVKFWSFLKARILGMNRTLIKFEFVIFYGGALEG